MSIRDEILREAEYYDKWCNVYDDYFVMHTHVEYPDRSEGMQVLLDEFMEDWYISENGEDSYSFDTDRERIYFHLLVMEAINED